MPTTTYPAYIAWHLDLAGVESIGQVLSRNRQRRIEKALAALASRGYRWGIETVDEEYLDRFVPLYTRHIGAKANGVVFDVRAKITAGRERGRQFESVSLWRGDEFIGGQIYGLQREALSVAYRIFPYDIVVKLPISCSYIAEHHLVARALELRKNKIIHGKDNNVFGLHSAIGLAEYKLNIGCVPRVSLARANHFLEVEALSLQQDALVFLAEEPRQVITAALLLTQHGEEAARASYVNLFAQAAVRVTVQPWT